MERGTDRERRAVRERWVEIERRHRAAKQLLGGTCLLLLGAVIFFLGLIPQACVSVGGQPHGCIAVVPRATRALFLLGGPLAVVAGLWRCRDALRT